MNPKLDTNQINYLNIGLMILSAGLAFAYPFELFILVYAVLGPLHYLTEISWLHDKNYYTKGKYDWLFLAAASLGVTALFLGLDRYAPRGTNDFFTYMAFAGGAILLLVDKNKLRFGLFILAVFIGLLLTKLPLFGAIFGLLLPTIIHVFVFTGLFILIGALKGRSVSGIFSLLVFVGVACCFIFFHPDHADYHVSDYAKENFGFLRDDGTGSNVFVSMNLYLVNAMGIQDFGIPTRPYSEFFHKINDFLYQNPSALALMSFIAFAYTYHYLNWFSKTSIIKWHEVSKGRFAVVLSLWIASLILYGVNYSLGFKWLFFLSFAHVMLEFPLNHLTMINIVKELGRIFAGGTKAARTK